MGRHSKDINDLIEELIDEGWSYVGQNRHIKVKSPGGNVMIISSSPNCPYAVSNARKLANKIVEKEQNEQRTKT